MNFISFHFFSWSKTNFLLTLSLFVLLSGLDQRHCTLFTIFLLTKIRWINWNIFMRRGLELSNFNFIYLNLNWCSFFHSCRVDWPLNWGAWGLGIASQYCYRIELRAKSLCDEFLIVQKLVFISWLGISFTFISLVNQQTFRQIDLFFIITKSQNTMTRRRFCLKPTELILISHRQIQRLLDGRIRFKVRLISWFWRYARRRNHRDNSWSFWYTIRNFMIQIRNNKIKLLQEIT